MKTKHWILAIVFIGLGLMNEAQAQDEYFEFILDEMNSTSIGSGEEEAAIGSATKDLQLQANQRTNVYASIRNSRERIAALNVQIANTKQKIDEAKNRREKAVQTKKLERLFEKKRELYAAQRVQFEKHLTPEQVAKLKVYYQQRAKAKQPKVEEHQNRGKHKDNVRGKRKGYNNERVVDDMKGKKKDKKKEEDEKKKKYREAKIRM